MKILLVSEYWQPRILGGGEISAALLAKNLSGKGIDVSVLTSHFNGLEKFEILDGVKIYRGLKTGSDPGSALSNIKRYLLFSKSVKKELIRLDREENFDLIHSMNITSMVGVSKAKKEIRKPMIVHINSPTPFCPRGILLKGDKECDGICNFTEFVRCILKFGSVSKMEGKWYLRYNPSFIFFVYSNFKNKKDSLKKFDFFIPISSFMKKLLLREGIPEERIEVIPNIVETERFFELESERREVPKILYLGPYAEFKGSQILLGALTDLKSDYQCNLYGSGPLKENLKKFTKEKNLKNVKINEEIPYSEIPKIYGEHDIVVFPSLVSEAFGRVAIEAMASKKPVIASRIGGVTDIVEDGKTGFFVEAGNVEELRKAIMKLIDKPELREKMGEEGRKVVKERYTADIITEKVVKVYEDLIVRRL